MIFHTLEFAELGLSGILGSRHAQNKSTFLTSSASRKVVQQTTSERRTTMQIWNFFYIPEVILQKHVGISWCEELVRQTVSFFIKMRMDAAMR